MFDLDNNTKENDNIETVNGLSECLTDWLENIENPFPDAMIKTIEQGEFRSRDGFIPFSHNKGTMELIVIEDIANLIGSGYIPNVIEKEIYETY